MFTNDLVIATPNQYHHALRGGLINLPEFLKNMFHIRLSNANAIILNAEYQREIRLPHLYTTSFCELNGVGEEVDQKPQPDTVINHDWVIEICINLKASCFCSARPEFCDRCQYQRCEIKFFRFEFQATGFDFGKVKDIVNQR